MTELTQDQFAALERAMMREGTTTPALLARWRVSPHRLYDYFGEKSSIVIEVHGAKNTDVQLITDAPRLQDLALAQAQIIAEQQAQLERYERRHQENRNRQTRQPWFVWTGQLIPDDQLDAYYEGLDDGLYTSHEKSEAEIEQLKARIAELEARLNAD